MDAMSQGEIAPLLARDGGGCQVALDDGIGQWSRAFDGKQVVVDKLFGGDAETLSPSSSVEVRCIHADGDCVVVEHSGRNELPDGRRYDNNYCWVMQFKDGYIQEIRGVHGHPVGHRDIRR